MSYFAEDVEKAIAENDVVKISGTFARVVPRTDGEGSVIELEPLSMSFPEKNLNFFPSGGKNHHLSSPCEDYADKWPSDTLRDLMAGRFPYEVPTAADLATPEAKWITNLAKGENNSEYYV